VLAHAQALQAQGKAREALVELNRIPRTDPARAEADRLLAVVQRELLATVTIDSGPGAAGAQKGTSR
jgi:hypothetical protein